MTYEKYLQLANDYEWQEECNKAIEAYKEAISLKPSDPYAHVKLGVVYRREGNYIRAEDCFNEALELDSDCVSAHYNLGVVYDQRGDYYKAIEAYKQALRIKRDYQPAITMLCYITRDKAEHLTSKVLQDAWEI